MALDASPIASIPDAFNPTGAVQQAYTLKGLIDENQLNELKLSKEKQSQADTAKAKQILSKADVSTPEGMIKAAQALQQGGFPDKAMDLMRESQSQQVTQTQLDEGHLKVLQASADVIGPASLQILQTLKTQGPAMARAQYQMLVSQVLPQLPSYLSQKIPSQAPQDDQQFAQLLQGAADQSQQARQIMASHLAQQKEDTAEKKETEAERHNRATEENASRKTTDTEKKAESFSDPQIQSLQAAIAAKGYSLPAGLRSKEQQLGVLKGLLARYPGKSADEIADLVGKGAIDYKAVTKATQTAASLVGKVEVANNELQSFIPIARQASSSVPRGRFMPFTKLQQMGERSISDPQLKKLYISTNTILNAYDLLAARGGTDKDKRAHNREMLETADSPESYEAALQMIQLEGQVAGKAATKATRAAAYMGDEEGGKSSENDPLGIR